MGAVVDGAAQDTVDPALYRALAVLDTEDGRPAPPLAVRGYYHQRDGLSQPPTARPRRRRRK
jgi:hypothetical protein